MKKRMDTLRSQKTLPGLNAGNGIPPALPIVSDPNGSYTGRGMDPNEKPVQDADDL